jgi:hypothetical protein
VSDFCGFSRAKDHSVRTIKGTSTQVLGRMNRRFDATDAQEGLPSIPPERQLKAKVLIALFSVPFPRIPSASPCRRPSCVSPSPLFAGTESI